MEEGIEVAIVSEENIHDKIYDIRGQKVMLDFELAEIYGYTTTRFNEQEKNNIEKFDDDFMFMVTKEEFANLMSKRSTSSWGGRRKLPKAFTEQGIYMLMTVLRGELAIKQSKASIKMTLKRTGGIYHDRFIVLDHGTDDERVFLCGASSKDAGAKVTSIVEDYGIEKYKILIDTLLKNEKLVLV